MLGGATPAIAVLLAGGSGIANLWSAERDRRTATLAILVAAAVLAAFLASQISPAFANRYFSAFVGPLVLLAAVGLSNAGRLGIVCLVLIAAFWFDPRTAQIESKSNARNVSQSIATYVTAGDLVVSTHPEQLPLMAYYLPQGVRYADSLGPRRRPAHVRLDRRARTAAGGQARSRRSTGSSSRCGPGRSSCSSSRSCAPPAGTRRGRRSCASAPCSGSAGWISTRACAARPCSRCSASTACPRACGPSCTAASVRHC
jgi:uncharacterized membrane protein YgcG